MTSVGPRPGRPAGLYVHIPFCARLCPYCDFAVSVRKSIPHAGYVDSLIEELRMKSEAGHLAGRAIESVYVGGGTPTLLKTDEFERFVDQLSTHDLSPGEWTFEANPIDVTPELVQAWTRLGFNRMSLGIQSFDDAYLKRLGRQHDGETARRALDVALSAGLDVSFDLIFAGPEHDLETWESDLSVVSSLPRVDHVSAYHLTVEPNTVFAHRERRGELAIPDEDVAVDMLTRLHATCAARGVEQYEVSSYAAPGKRSLHNSHYWRGSEYLGLGVGAHGLLIDDQVIRTSNTRNLAEYLATPTTSGTTEIVDPKLHLTERVFSGFRSAWGLDFDELRVQFEGAVRPATLDAAQGVARRVVDAGWAVWDGNTVVPTPSGFLFADLAASWAFDGIEG